MQKTHHSHIASAVDILEKVGPKLQSPKAGNKIVLAQNGVRMSLEAAGLQPSPQSPLLPTI